MQTRTLTITDSFKWDQKKIGPALFNIPIHHAATKYLLKEFMLTFMLSGVIQTFRHTHFILVSKVDLQ